MKKYGQFYDIMIYQVDCLELGLDLDLDLDRDLDLLIIRDLALALLPSRLEAALIYF